MPRRGVRLGLANTRIAVRAIEISGVADSQQLENAVDFRAHEIISSPARNAVLDYHVLGTRVDDEGETTHEILLVIAFRDSVDRYLAATDAANLELVGHRSRRVRASPRSPRSSHARGARSRGRDCRRLDRLRPDDARDLGRVDLPVHPRARVGGRECRSRRSSAR